VLRSLEKNRGRWHTPSLKGRRGQRSRLVLQQAVPDWVVHVRDVEAAHSRRAVLVDELVAVIVGPGRQPSGRLRLQDS
jgi:hypothetical protein